MRSSLILALVLCTAATSVAMAADNETRPDNATGATAKTPQDWCANDTCPVDGKPVNKDIKTSAYHTTTGTKASDQNVGFCSDACRTAYESNPSKYDKDLAVQIQHRREARNPKAN